MSNPIESKRWFWEEDPVVDSGKATVELWALATAENVMVKRRRLPVVKPPEVKLS